MPAWVVAGTGFGDEGKGVTTFGLAQKLKSNLIVRYNGGPQAAHNVITSDDRHHCFRQFGSGSLIPGVRTYLSRFMLVSPPAMMVEDFQLEQIGLPDALESLMVDEKCVVITPFHRASNRLLEISRGDNKHGSTGFGIGQARRDQLDYGDKVLQVKDLLDRGILKDKLEFHRELAWNDSWRAVRSMDPDISVSVADVYKEFETLTSKNTSDWFISECRRWISRVHVVNGMPGNFHNPIFEGAQGALLDETHGFHPHTTWTDITFRNAETVLQEAGFTDRVVKIGVMRCYHTRHGAGPLPSECKQLTAYATEKHNSPYGYAGNFRTGHFDFALLSKACDILGKLDHVVINHLDLFTSNHCGIPVTHSGSDFSPVTARERISFKSKDEFIKRVRVYTGDIPVTLGYGPKTSDRVFVNSLLQEK